MARIAVIAALIFIAGVCGGCVSTNNTIEPQNLITTTVYDGSSMGEIDLVEQITLNRQEYYRGLELLSDYYARHGNSRKLTWANKELRALKKMPKHVFISNVVPPKSLKASISIAEADALYMDAEQLLKQANVMGSSFTINLPAILRSKNTLMLSLAKYTQLIKNYPNSDKIGKAAFRAGYIQELFKDYHTALSYYQRSYQWDENISAAFPARFKAAYLMDKKLHQRSQAVDLYQQALTNEGVRWNEWREFANKRIRTLTKTETDSDTEL